MDSKQIETLSVNAVRNSITMTNLLEQYICDNDKEPFWDGYVNIYNKKEHEKENFYGRMPVQIKGTEKRDLSKEEISYSAKIHDLKGYLKDGGIIFFVVYISDNGNSNQIYYVELTPKKLKDILLKTDGKKSKSIYLKKFPNSPKKKETIFLNCFDHCTRQKSYINIDFISLDELDKQGLIEKIIIPFTAVKGIDYKEALLTNDNYLYAKLKGNEVYLPLATTITNGFIKEKKKSIVKVGNKTFYNEVNIVENKDAIKIVLGESLTITLNKNNNLIDMIYSNSHKVRILAHDLDFALSCISNGAFSYNGTIIPVEFAKKEIEDFDVKKQQEYLKNYKKIVLLLDYFNCKKDLDLSLLTDKDVKMLSFLISAIEDKKTKEINKELSSVQSVNVGPLKFAVLFAKCEQDKNLYKIEDFFQSDSYIFYEIIEGVNYPISQYSILKAQDIVKIDNIRYDKLLSSFQNVEYHEKRAYQTNQFLLELLKAYDMSNNEIILTTALAFAKWLINTTEKELPYAIKLLNLYQVYKRQRKLNNKEMKKLYDLIEGNQTNYDILVGAYLLLEQQIAAEKYYNLMSEIEKEDFKHFPIYKFWKELI